MYTRRTVWFFLFAILAMACKEEVPLISPDDRPLVARFSAAFTQWRWVGRYWRVVGFVRVLRHHATF